MLVPHTCGWLFSEIHIYDLTCGFKNLPFSTPVYSLYSTFFPLLKWFISDNLKGNSTCQPALLFPVKVLHPLCGHPLLSLLFGTWVNIWPPRHWRNYKPLWPDLYILETLWNPLLQGHYLFLRFKTRCLRTLPLYNNQFYNSCKYLLGSLRNLRKPSPYV